jgi:hypothetical protein
LQSGASVLIDTLIDGCQQGVLNGGASFPYLIEEYYGSCRQETINDPFIPVFTFQE